MSKKEIKQPVAGIAPFGLRMQDELKERIARVAIENEHSINSEIVHRLEESFLTRFDSLDDFLPPEWKLAKLSQEIKEISDFLIEKQKKEMNNKMDFFHEKI